jgi:hypothetical protein
MATIGLMDPGSKIVNFAVMKASSYHKSLGDTVVLNPKSLKGIDKLYVSVTFDKHRDEAAQLSEKFSNVLYGGVGWEVGSKLPEEIEIMKPDFDLYKAEDLYPRIGGIMKKETRMRKAQIIVDAGIGFHSRGCDNFCKFCKVGPHEGRLRVTTEIKDMLNPRSNVLILLDNNLTEAPDAMEVLKEIKERQLIIDITQGLNVRVMGDEFAKILSEVRHLRSVHYAWDNICQERSVLKGIELLAKHVKKWRHLCFTLVGYDSTFDEDYYRFIKLKEVGVESYVMCYNEQKDLRLDHFRRYVNGKFFRKCKSFDDYEPWKKVKAAYLSGVIPQEYQPSLFAA